MVLATEIAILRLQKDLDPEVAGSKAALLWKTAATIISQQPGFVRQYWGLKVEDQNLFVLTVDWDDVQDHKNFVNSEAYKPFTAGLADLFDFEAQPPFIFHVNFTSDSVKARESPVTEFAPFSLPLDATSDTKSSLEDNILALVKHCTVNGRCQGSAAGWALEEMDNSNATSGKASLLQALIGWPTVEDHMNIRGTPEFLEIVKPVRGMVLPPAAGHAMFHVKLHGKPAQT